MQKWKSGFLALKTIAEVLSRRSLDLAEFFIVSSVVLIADDNEPKITVSAKHASGIRCPRSWRWVPQLVSVEPWGEVFSPDVLMFLSRNS